jgi:hypothetical protein
MKYSLLILAFALLAVVVFSDRASADYWVRLDRPWRNWELDQAIVFCRMQPRLNIQPAAGDNIMFVDTLMGRQINACMHALGWIAVAG